MNHVNRGFNRTILFIAGLLLVAAGALAALAALLPSIGDAWTRNGEAAIAAAQDLHGATTVTPDAAVTWLDVGVVVACALVAVLCVIAIVRMLTGRRRDRVRIAVREDDLGRIVISDTFAADALQQSLAQRPEIVSSKISGGRYGGSEVLHVSVTPRSGVSPREVADTVTGLANNLARLTGSTNPVYVSIHAGLRSRIAAPPARVL